MSQAIQENARKQLPEHFAFKIVVIITSRLISNTSRRFIYTFAGVFSRGLGVPLTAITSLIAINQATSVLGIFFGPYGDRFGYKVLMLTAFSFLSIGMFLGGLLPFYSVLVVSLFLAGLGKSVLDPAVQAWVGRRVPYQNRGFIIGLLELSWAGSTLIGIPLIGLLIDYAGWQVPFLVMGSLLLFCFVIILVLFPSDRDRTTQPAGKSAVGKEMLKTWSTMIRHRPALGMIVFSLCLSLANDIIFVTYGIWLEVSFTLSIVALGFGTIAIGAAEILGELLTAFFSDRIGLKRAVICGVVVSIFSFLLLPFAGRHLIFALASLFLIFISFEFSIVTSLSLCTELTPATRASMISVYFATAGIGRVLGALAGGFLWERGGLNFIALVSAFVSALGLMALLWGLRHWKAAETPIFTS